MSPSLHRRLLRLVPLAPLVLLGCQSNPYYDPAQPHHTPAGFRNLHYDQPRGGFWKWRWQRFWAGLPKEPPGGWRFEVLPPDLNALHHHSGEPSLTWIGHATLLLQVGGLNVLTDPHLSERASPLSFYGPKRRVPPALSAAQLPPIAAVVISHNHYDHLDVQTVRWLAAQPGGGPRFFVPLGLRPWFVRLGITNVVELDWWESAEYRGLVFNLVPVQHFSARTPFDRYETLWGGWVIEHPTLRFFFAGDTGYTPDFLAIRARLAPIDLAALPIGAYEPRWFMRPMHLNPEEAVQALLDLDARYAVAMHWGTFAMTDEPLDEPPRRLHAALRDRGIPAERFFLLQHGETRALAPPLN